MSDINFIPKKNVPSREKENKGEEIKWSSPAPFSDQKNKEENKVGEKILLRIFSFWKKDKKDNKDDKGSIKNLREEVLKTIKEKEEKSVPVFSSEKTKEDKKVEKKEEGNGEKEKEPSRKKEEKKKITEPLSKIWEKTNVLATNLIEEEMASFFNFKKNLAFLIVVFSLVILILGGSYLWLYFLGKEISKGIEDATRLSVTQNQEMALEKEKKEIYAFGRKLELVEYLLNKHVYWTNFCRFLEENTLNNVYYKSLSGDLGGSYELPAVTKNYSLINEQAKAFLESKKVKEVSVKSGQLGVSSTGEGGITFNLNFKIDPNIFFKDGNKRWK